MLVRSVQLNRSVYYLYHATVWQLKNVDVGIESPHVLIVRLDVGLVDPL